MYVWKVAEIMSATAPHILGHVVIYSEGFWKNMSTNQSPVHTFHRVMQLNEVAQGPKLEVFSADRPYLSRDPPSPS